jgi:hypothetical protein
MMKFCLLSHTTRRIAKTEIVVRKFNDGHAASATRVYSRQYGQVTTRLMLDCSSPSSSCICANPRCDSEKHRKGRV